MKRSRDAALSLCLHRRTPPSRSSPKGTVDSLLKPENKTKLVKVLTYHVVPGKVMSSAIAGKRLAVVTVEGENVHIDGRHGVKVNNSRVVQADIQTDNGVIHVIDKELLPKN